MCLTTRVMHTEVAHSLLTDSVIWAKRFIAQHEKLSHIVSDNGSDCLRNFQGAD